MNNPTSRVVALPKTADVVRLERWGTSDGIGYEVKLRDAFEFLRRHGRYSSGEMAKILRAADRAEEMRLYPEPDTDNHSPFPTLLLLASPTRYDPDTEVKYGGMMGVAIAWSDRLMLAIHADRHRQGAGTLLLEELRCRSSDMALRTWVSSGNVAGQMFLLASGWKPVSLNSAGAVCYAPHHPDPMELDSLSVLSRASEEAPTSLPTGGTF